MPDDRLAQWLLESVTTRDRAVSTLGDLRESAAKRGKAWFWWGVIGTTASLVWRGMFEDWRGVLNVAVRGLLLTLVVQFCLAGTFAVVSLALALRSSNMSTAGGIAYQSPWLGGWTGTLMMMAGQFFVGRWIARRAPGRALPACLALMILQLVLACVVLVPSRVILRVGSDWLGAFGEILLADVFCFLGALVPLRRGNVPDRS